MKSNYLSFAIAIIVGCILFGCSGSGSEPVTIAPTVTPVPTKTVKPTPKPTPTQIPDLVIEPTVEADENGVPMPALVLSVTSAPPAQTDLKFEWLRKMLGILDAAQLKEYNQKIYGINVGGWEGKIVQTGELEIGEPVVVVEIQDGDIKRPFVVLKNISQELLNTFSEGQDIVFSANMVNIGPYGDYKRVILMACSEIYINK